MSDDNEYISMEDALVEMERIYQNLQRERQKARKAEADYWRSVFNEDRVEALEKALDDVETILYQVIGFIANGDPIMQLPIDGLNRATRIIDIALDRE